MILTTNILPLYERLDTAAFGETLRALTWDQKEDDHGFRELGCYSTFDLHDYVQEMTESERRIFWENLYPNSDTEDIDEWVQMGKGGRIQTLDGRIEYAYFWDGDGVLCYRVFDSSDLLIAEIINNDCKKTGRWTKDIADEYCL